MQETALGGEGAVQSGTPHHVSDLALPASQGFSLRMQEPHQPGLAKWVALRLRVLHTPTRVLGAGAETRYSSLQKSLQIDDTPPLPPDPVATYRH